LVQGQESFSFAALSGTGQNFEQVQGWEAFHFDTFDMSNPGVLRLEEKPLGISQSPTEGFVFGGGGGEQVLWVLGGI